MPAPKWWFVGCLAFVSGCGSSLGPECDALARCCDVQGDDNCRRAAEESDKRDGGEQACASARSVFVQTNICEDEMVMGGTPKPKSCENLVACCGQLGAEAGACLATARQLEAGVGAEADCQTTFAAYVDGDRCRVAGATGPEDDATTCGDGIDNDGNGFSDCDDFACLAAVASCQDPEVTVALCTDGIDNDGDGGIDCNDSGCIALGTLCVPENNNTSCADGFDNDADGFTDCQDRDCNQNPNVTICGGNQTEDNDAACSDNIDNDGDGFTDCDDFDCSREPTVTVCGARDPENTDARCSDNMDNDGDGFVDCDDRDCFGGAVTVCGPPPDPEDTDALCSDNIDNDGDGFTDCDDFDCSMGANVTICP